METGSVLGEGGAIDIYIGEVGDKLDSLVVTTAVAAAFEDQYPLGSFLSSPSRPPMSYPTTDYMRRFTRQKMQGGGEAFHQNRWLRETQHNGARERPDPCSSPRQLGIDILFPKPFSGTYPVPKLR